MNPGDADPSLDGRARRRAGVRPAGAVDRRRPPASRPRRSGYTVVDHAVGRHHAPHRDHPRARRRAALAARTRAALLDHPSERFPAAGRRARARRPARVGEVHRVLQLLLARGRLGARPRHDPRDARRPRPADEGHRRCSPSTAARRSPASSRGRSSTSSATLPAITLDPQLESEMSASRSSRPATAPTSVSTRAAPTRSARPSRTRSSAPRRAGSPARCCSARPAVRRHLKALTAHAAPRLTVLSYNEIVPTVRVETVGLVSA